MQHNPCTDIASVPFPSCSYLSETGFSREAGDMEILQDSSTLDSDHRVARLEITMGHCLHALPNLLMKFIALSDEELHKLTAHL